jgi:glycogen operon protein
VRSLAAALSVVLVLVFAACQRAPQDDGPDALRRRPLIGAMHPSSGAFAPVAEKSWASGAWGLGAHFVSGEGSTLQIGVYSAHATRVLLEIYPSATGKDATYDYWLQKGADSVWRGQLARVPGKALYAFRAFGPNWPFHSAWRRGNSAAGLVADVDAAGNRFNPNKALFDPYARELTHDKNSAALHAAGENAELFGTGGGAGQTYSGVDRRNVDTGRWIPKSIALEDATNFGTRPHLPAQDAAIYEAHLRGLTAHPSAARLGSILKGVPGFEAVQDIPEALRGTYQGAGLMAPYLKALGFTTIELMPIHESDNELNPDDRPGGNYWGYMTYGYFAPDRHYSSDKNPGGPTREFKQMVAAFHALGMEVYLDVVYNHAGEGGTWDATRRAAELTSFRGLDNASYYALSADRSAYFDTSGCGNNLDASQAPVVRLVEDSLQYWISEMGVDGFRFDEAAILGRDAPPSYAFNPDARLLADIASLAAANDVEVIAEPWDSSTYQVGQFPPGWGEWNGRYRDAVRRYIKSDASGSGGTTWADAFNGDYSNFNGRGGPQRSINLIDAHDGFTLADLVSYDAKTNAARAWPFGPSDGGADHDDSWGCGGDPALRRQAMRNLVVFQSLSRGVPMLVYGDEFGRTQNGNNNPYDVDSVATWNNYDMIATDAPQAVATADATGGAEPYLDSLGTDTDPNGFNDHFLFVRYLLALRAAHPALRQADYSMPISFSKADGSSGFDSRSDLMGRIYIAGRSVGDADFLVLTNMYWGPGAFTVPPAPAATSWVRLVDTASWAEPGGNTWDPARAAAIAATYTVNPRSIVVLMAR